MGTRKKQGDFSAKRISDFDGLAEEAAREFRESGAKFILLIGEHPNIHELRGEIYKKVGNIIINTANEIGYRGGKLPLGYYAFRVGAEEDFSYISGEEEWHR